jgi:hypothetical protein
VIADFAAKEAAAKEEVSKEWADVMGFAFC